MFSSTVWRSMFNFVVFCGYLTYITANENKSFILSFIGRIVLPYGIIIHRHQSMIFYHIVSIITVFDCKYTLKGWKTVCIYIRVGKQKYLKMFRVNEYTSKKTYTFILPHDVTRVPGIGKALNPITMASCMQVAYLDNAFSLFVETPNIMCLHIFSGNIMGSMLSIYRKLHKVYKL